MGKTLIFVGGVYVLLLIIFSLVTREKTKSSKGYFLAGSNLGAVLGLFTFAATLFSTFTLLGMPDFFRVHGIGAWIFLAVSDAVMVFGILWIGYHLRKRAADTNYIGMSGFISHAYKSRWAGYVAFIGAFLFLIPYVAIQIRGVAIFLLQAFPGFVPMWVWAVGIVIIMLVYSEIGGLKAIIYNDMFQGLLLLIVIWIVAGICLEKMGGFTQMFESVEESNSALLAVPGPKGLFDFQFLLGSMVAICLIPFTQPQVSTRLVIMKDHRSLARTAVGLGTFALLVIFPTLLIGMYGAIYYPDDSTSDFLGKALIWDQPGPLGAFVLIGLVAAAISTADSQIFALGGETRSLMEGEDKKMIRNARIAIVVFAILSLIFALLSSDQLVLLARSSFAGTALLAPMIFLAIFSKQSHNMQWIPSCTLGAIGILVASQLGVIPTEILGIRLDLLLLVVLAVMAVVGNKFK